MNAAELKAKILAGGIDSVLTDGLSVPADKVEGQRARYAKAVFDCLRLSGYARADFIMDENGEFWCLEVNNLPGMTPMSLLPQEAAAAGIEYGELCEIIVNMAVEK